MSAPLAGALCFALGVCATERRRIGDSDRRGFANLRRRPCRLDVRLGDEQLLVQIDRVTIGHPGDEIDGEAFHRLAALRVEVLLRMRDDVLEELGDQLLGLQDFVAHALAEELRRQAPRLELERERLFAVLEVESA